MSLLQRMGWRHAVFAHAEDALKGLAGMSVLYGRSVIEPRPLFRRREYYE